MIIRVKRNRRAFLTIVGLLVLFTHPFLYAESAMTWQDCIKETAKKNPDISAAASAFESEKNKAKAAYSGFLPQVSGDVNYNSGNFSAGSSGSFATDTYSASVTASQNVFSGLRDTGLVKQKSASADASRFALKNTMVKISYDLKNAFAQMLYSQENSRLQEEIIKRRKENAELVGLRFDAGMENKGNLLLSNALLSQAKYDKRQAERSIEVSRQQLAKVIGREDDSGIKIAGKIPIEAPSGIGNAFDIVEENPQYQNAVAKEKAAKAAVTLATASFLPTLDLSASAAKQGNTWSMAGNNTTWGFNVGVPIFNGANNVFMFKSSQADLSAARSSRQNIENDLMSKLKQYYADFVNAHEKLKVDKDFLDAATVRADIARNRYRNGLLSFDNWDIIENDLINKQQVYIMSERSLYLAEAAWKQAAGRGVFE